MGFLFICLNQAAHQVEGMLVRRYGRKHGAGGMFFNAIICLFSMFFFVITDRDGRVIGRGRNRRQQLHDATAHAEVEAIREACAKYL